jgi:hypothetical protein
VEGGDGEGADSETPSLLSYTLRYVSLVELLVFIMNQESEVFLFYYESWTSSLKDHVMRPTRIFFSFLTLLRKFKAWQFHHHETYTSEVRDAGRLWGLKEKLRGQC